MSTNTVLVFGTPKASSSACCFAACLCHSCYDTTSEVIVLFQEVTTVRRERSGTEFLKGCLTRFIKFYGDLYNENSIVANLLVISELN